MQNISILNVRSYNSYSYIAERGFGPPNYNHIIKLGGNSEGYKSEDSQRRLSKGKGGGTFGSLSNREAGHEQGGNGKEAFFSNIGSQLSTADSIENKIHKPTDNKPGITKFQGIYLGSSNAFSNGDRNIGADHKGGFGKGHFGSRGDSGSNLGHGGHGQGRSSSDVDFDYENFEHKRSNRDFVLGDSGRSKYQTDFEDLRSSSARDFGHGRYGHSVGYGRNSLTLGDLNHGISETEKQHINGRERQQSSVYGNYDDTLTLGNDFNIGREPQQNNLRHSGSYGSLRTESGSLEGGQTRLGGGRGFGFGHSGRREFEGEPSERFGGYGGGRFGGQREFESHQTIMRGFKGGIRQQFNGQGIHGRGQSSRRGGYTRW